jgi:hypothetical protein
VRKEGPVLGDNDRVDEMTRKPRDRHPGLPDRKRFAFLPRLFSPLAHQGGFLRILSLEPCNAEPGNRQQLREDKNGHEDGKRAERVTAYPAEKATETPFARRRGNGCDSGRVLLSMLLGKFAILDGRESPDTPAETGARPSRQSALFRGAAFASSRLRERPAAPVWN